MPALHVVFGANGSIGNAIIRELVKQDKQVRGVTRSGQADVPEGVEIIKGDTAQTSDTLRASQGADVIYNAVFPPTQDAILEAASQVNAKLVLVDNLYMYAPQEGPLTESSDNHYKERRQGKARADMTEELLHAHEVGKVRAVIGRASDVFGPRATSGMMGPRVFQNALQGKTVSVLGNLDQPHPYSFVEDVAKALIILAEDDNASGQIWHVPGAETLSTRAFLEMVFEEAGQKPKLQSASRNLMTMIGLFNPAMRDLKKEKLYQFEVPWVVDQSKFVKAFGNGVTPHRQAIRQTLEWYKAHPEVKG